MGGVFKHKDKAKKPKKSFFHMSTWKLVLIFVILGFLAATLLRFDHIKMTELRTAVLTADKANDDTKIAESLNSLKSFVSKHIIFNLVDDNGAQYVTFGTGPFYLENLYTRKVTEEIAKAQEAAKKDTSNPNGNIYAKVAAVCDAQGAKNGWRYPDKPYIECWQDDLANYRADSSMSTTEQANLPSPELYRYEYSSPIWYPCLSGIVILICAILAIILVVRLIIAIFVGIALLVTKNS